MLDRVQRTTTNKRGTPMSTDVRVPVCVETWPHLIPVPDALTASHARPGDRHFTRCTFQVSKIDGTNDEDSQGVMPVNAQVQPTNNLPSTLYFHLPRAPPLPSNESTHSSTRYCSRRRPKIRTAEYNVVLPLSPKSGSSSPAAVAVTAVGVALGSPSDITFRYAACEQNMSSQALPHRPDKVQRYYQIHPTSAPELQTHHRKKSSWKALAFWKADRQRQRDPPDPATSSPPAYSATKPAESLRCPPPTPVQQSVIPRGITRLEKRMAAERQAIIHTYQSRAGLSPALQKLDARTAQPHLLQASASRHSHGLGLNYAPDETDEIAERTVPLPSAPVDISPKLDLEIPDARLDRYSVMFEQLLKPQRQPSLLERRQRRSLVLKTKTGHKAAEPVQTTKSAYRATMPPLSTPLNPPVSPLTARLETVMSAPSGPVSPLIEAVENQMDQGEPTPKPTRPALHDRALTEPLPAIKTQLDEGTPTSSASSVLLRDDTPQSEHLDDDGDNYFSPDTPATDTSEVISIHDGGLDDMERVARVTSQQQLKLFPVISNQKPRYRDHLELEKQMVEVSVARQVSVNRARQTVQQAMVTGKQPFQRPKMVELSGHKHAAKKSQCALIGFE